MLNINFKNKGRFTLLIVMFFVVSITITKPINAQNPIIQTKYTADPAPDRKSVV